MSAKIPEEVQSAIENYTNACGSTLMPMRSHNRLTLSIAAAIDAARKEERDFAVNECLELARETQRERMRIPVHEERRRTDHLLVIDTAKELADRLRARSKEDAP